MQAVRANKSNEMQSLVYDHCPTGGGEIRVPAALKETGEKYQKLREDMGLQVKDDDKQMTTIEQKPTPNRTEDSEDSDADEEDGKPGLGRSGLGSGMRRDMADWGM